MKAKHQNKMQGRRFVPAYLKRFESWFASIRKLGGGTSTGEAHQPLPKVYNRGLWWIW
jgi:hypothetical protein